MPRYFFHIRDGTSTPDETGTELANWHEAHLEAVRFAGEVIRDHARQIALCDAWYLEVTDESQAILLRLDLVCTASPVLSSQRSERNPLA